ncbi:MAG: ATP-dependent 6-phosphofructokinase [Brevinematales bacterium]|nr:ATP-dependent 6-phosphofructokinase [Brevinematales bacterium]
MEFGIKSLGEAKYDSPLVTKYLSPKTVFISDNQKVLFDAEFDASGYPASDFEHSFELAGPREKIYFDPSKVNCAVATCGGLCPGLNNVIRSVVMQSHYRYGVNSILGIRYGYNGLNPANGYEPMKLTPQNVRGIHEMGGTVLGSSRGGTEDFGILVDTLEKWKINILYAIGGDGTLRGANEIAHEAEKRGMELAVVGIPKTIDNDISYIDRSFGFQTAVAEAVSPIYAAHAEAEGAVNGIGLVKLMGRYSGFISASATLAINDVNFCLIPEIPLKLDVFLQYLEERIVRRGHAVICVAEGVGQELMVETSDQVQRDASNNIVFKDIGVFLKKKINEYFKSRNIEVNLKYIDPSYMIRSAPACPMDAIFCAQLGQYAVHAGMSGKTGLVIGRWNNMFTHVPIDLAISKRKFVDVNSLYWNNVIEATGQPVSWDTDLTR